MCIVKAVTGNSPWRGKYAYRIAHYKQEWRPEDNREADENAPPELDGEVRALVQRMCCHDPGKRLKITSVVRELECLAAKEDAMAQGRSTNMRTDTLFTIDTYKNGEVAELWAGIKTNFDEDKNLTRFRQQLEGLSELYRRLQMGKYPQTVLQRFGVLLADFHGVLKTLASSKQARIMQLSATRRRRQLVQ